MSLVYSTEDSNYYIGRELENEMSFDNVTHEGIAPFVQKQRVLPNAVDVLLSLLFDVPDHAEGAVHATLQRVHGPHSSLQGTHW